MENQHPNQILIETISNRVTEYNDDFAYDIRRTRDYRKKGHLLSEIYPWPIGQEIRRLIGVDYLDINNERLKQIFRLTEKTMQFVSFCLLADLWNNIDKSEAVLSSDLQEQLKQLNGKPAMGVWAGLIRATLNILENISEGTFFDYTIINKKAISKCAEPLVKLRNENVHNYAEIDFMSYENALSHLLQELAFLCKYKMVTVNHIHVIATRFANPLFKHRLSFLNSTSKDFVGDNFQMKKFTDSLSVLLMHNYEEPDSYLNLSPFVIDTAMYMQEEFRKPIKGVFMYNGQHNKKPVYTGTAPPDNINVGDFNFGNKLFKELDLFYKNMSR